MISSRSSSPRSQLRRARQVQGFFGAAAGAFAGAATGADASYIQAVAQREREEIRRRQQIYRDDQPAPTLAGRTVVVVDDGLATGTTMRAALRSIRMAGPAAIVVAVPVASVEGLALVAPEADEVVCLASPVPFEAVGCHYVDLVCFITGLKPVEVSVRGVEGMDGLARGVARVGAKARLDDALGHPRDDRVELTHSS